MEEVMSKIKHIFSDLDGTLLDDSGKISLRTQAVVKSCGIPFTLVSARTPQAMMALIEELSLCTPQIAFNGGLIFNREQILAQYPLDFPTAKQLIQKFKIQFPEINLSIYTLENWYIERSDKDIEQEMQYTPQKPVLTDFEVLLAEPLKIFKILLIIPDTRRLVEVQKNLKYLEKQNVIVQKTWESYLEITSISAQKSYAIKKIADDKHLKNSELAAFGDNYNDLAMLKEVGLPIVMGNAPEEIKKIGKFVTKSNEEDGVAFGIEHYIL